MSQTSPVSASEPMSLEKPDGWIVKNKFGAVELFLHHEIAMDALNAWGSFIGPVYQRTAGLAQTPDHQDVRWAVNVLLEKIAEKFEGWETLDLWRSDAAATVRSFKHASPDTSTIRQNMVASDPSPENIEPSPEPLD